MSGCSRTRTDETIGSLSVVEFGKNKFSENVAFGHSKCAANNLQVNLQVSLEHVYKNYYKSYGEDLKKVLIKKNLPEEKIYLNSLIHVAMRCILLGLNCFHKKDTYDSNKSLTQHR